MTSLIGRLLAVTAVAFAGAVASAQEQSDNLIATMTDWNVFVEESPKECWGVSKPKEWVANKDGNPVPVTRSDILLFVTFRPGKPGEISYTGGYPFAGGSTVEVAIDGQTYQLFTEGEWAWPGSAEDDATLLAAMKSGTTAVLTGRSGRGNVTTDTFSLRGFTAAMEDAEKRCK
jgi:Invasion associated locus B (IalB) protein